MNLTEADIYGLKLLDFHWQMIKKRLNLYQKIPKTCGYFFFINITKD